MNTFIYCFASGYLFIWAWGKILDRRLAKLNAILAERKEANKYQILCDGTDELVMACIQQDIDLVITPGIKSGPLVTSTWS